MTEQKTDMAVVQRQVAGVAINTISELNRVATALTRGGIAPKGYTVEKTQAILMMAMERGIPPIFGLQTIAPLPSGKLMIEGKALLSLIHQSGKLADAPKFEYTNADGMTCTITMKRKGHATPYVQSFSLEDAKIAGLTGKDNWKKYPKIMLKWRALALIANEAFPDVCAGMVTPDEAEEIEATFHPTPQEAQAVEAKTEPLDIASVFADPAAINQEQATLWRIWNELSLKMTGEDWERFSTEMGTEPHEINSMSPVSVLDRATAAMERILNERTESEQEGQ